MARTRYGIISGRRMQQRFKKLAKALSNLQFVLASGLVACFDIPERLLFIGRIVSERT
jgi:hypothetical protein